MSVRGASSAVPSVIATVAAIVVVAMPVTIVSSESVAITSTAVIIVVILAAASVITVIVSETVTSTVVMEVSFLPVTLFASVGMKSLELLMATLALYIGLAFLWRVKFETVSLVIR